MREIKFRAWDKDEKCYTHAESVYVRGDGIIFHGKIAVNNLIVEQYTGLKDINGKEIFEGDICKHYVNIKYEIAEIKFFEGAFILCVHYMHLYALTNFACCRTFEVIGNINENHELLNSVS